MERYIITPSGEIITGEAFGYVPDTPCEICTEITFNTSMVGFSEVITDPASAGLAVVATFPMGGNYGAIGEDILYSPVIAAYITREWCDSPSNFRADGTLDELLKKYKIPGVCALDTRYLTKMIRENGSFSVAITDFLPENQEKMDEIIGKIRNFKHTIPPCVRENIEVIPPIGEKKFTLAVVDFGKSVELAALLSKLGAQVTLVPPKSALENIEKISPDAVILSDGFEAFLGDADAENTVRDVAEKYKILALGVSHLLLAKVNGSEIVKLPHGHRGANHPVKSIDSGKTVITAQNHSYAVVKNSHTAAFNLNDGTSEAEKYPSGATSIQYFPTDVEIAEFLENL